MTTILIFLTVCAAGCIVISFLDKEEMEGNFAAYHKIMKKQKNKEKELNIQTSLQDEESDMPAKRKAEDIAAEPPVKDNPENSLQDKKSDGSAETKAVCSVGSSAAEGDRASAERKKKAYSKPEVKVMKVPDLYSVEKTDTFADISNKKNADDFYDFYDVDDDW